MYFYRIYNKPKEKHLEEAIKIYKTKFRFVPKSKKYLNLTYNLFIITKTNKIYIF